MRLSPPSSRPKNLLHVALCCLNSPEKIIDELARQLLNPGLGYVGYF
jgi:hypothetical protein